MQKPSPGEYREYFQKYIDLVPNGDYIKSLEDNTQAAVTFFNSIPAEKHEYRYADGKWSTKEVLQHLMDTERVFSYRALAAIRGDGNSLLPSMDENRYAANTDVSNRTMQDMTEEFAAIRLTTHKLFENTTEQQTMLTANANGFHTSTRAIAFMIIGHVIHHMNIIKERYL